MTRLGSSVRTHCRIIDLGADMSYDRIRERIAVIGKIRMLRDF
jgi:hypothetical protein